MNPLRECSTGAMIVLLPYHESVNSSVSLYGLPRRPARSTEGKTQARTTAFSQGICEQERSRA